MTEISKEYGTALYMLACENNKKEEYADGLSVISDVFTENPEYITFLSSPGIPLEERLGAIDAAFKESICEDVLSYIKLICEKGRISCFFESAEEYNTLLKESQKIVNVKVVSAVELTEDEKEKLNKGLEKKLSSGINTSYVIDESLIGGILIEADGKILDGSVRTRLRDIKDVINR